MQQMDSLQDLMVDTLQDLYDAETQILAFSPEMVKAATSQQLQDALMQHMNETQQQVQRLGKVFASFGEEPKGKPCEGMRGILKENRSILKAQGDPDVLDAGLILGQQKIEHYEIAGYGTAVTFAKLLGNQEAARLLAQTLSEEEKVDKKLTQLATSKINPDAEAAGGIA